MVASVPVCLESCPGYDREILQHALARVMGSLGPLQIFSGCKVLLKPNLISARAPSLACTHPLFIAAVAAWFLDHGCRVTIGDSPAFGSAAAVVERQGVSRAVRGMGVKVVDFTSVVPRQLSSGVFVGVAAEALDCDFLVNLPKIKAHDQMYVSMAVKNIFGIVKGPRKSWLHMRYGNSHQEFAGLLLDLHALLPDNITVADGIEVMHRHGPMRGESLALGCLAGSRSPVALDTAMLALLDLDCCKSPLWCVACKRGLSGVNLGEIVFPLQVPGDFSGSGFIAPEQLSPVRFSPWRYVVNSLKRVVLALHRG